MASVETIDKENLEKNEQYEESSSEKEDLAIDETTEDKEPEESIPMVSGKRLRTAVKAFNYEVPQKPKKELEFEVGNGIPLGDIGIVAEQMMKTLAEHYSILHKILYGVAGIRNMRKKNIKRFNGFNFDKDSKKHESKVAAIKRLKVAERNNVIKLLGLPRSSTIEGLMDFLMCPSDLNCHSSKKKSSTPAKRKRSSSKGDGDETKKKNGTKSKPSNAKHSKATPKKAKSTPVKTPRRTKSKKKKVASTDEEEETSLSDSATESEEDELPSPKKRKLSESITDISKDDSFTGPSEDDLIIAIKKTVEGLDLEEVSMKQAITKVYEMFPGEDLSSKKSFIKEKIRELIG